MLDPPQLGPGTDNEPAWSTNRTMYLQRITIPANTPLADPYTATH